MSPDLNEIPQQVNNTAGEEQPTRPEIPLNVTGEEPVLSPSMPEAGNVTDQKKLEDVQQFLERQAQVNQSNQDTQGIPPPVHEQPQRKGLMQDIKNKLISFGIFILMLFGIRPPIKKHE